MTDFLKSILDWLYVMMGNYGWAVVVFTIMIRLVLLPFDYKSRVGMRKTTAIQPKIQELQAKYGKDQEKLNRKMSELYKKEKINPLSGCLPLLLSYPIIIIMWGAMRGMANQQLAAQILAMLQNPDDMPDLAGWLWVKNLWVPDSPFAAVLPTLQNIQMVASEDWLKVLTPETLALLPPELSLTMESFAKENLQATVQAIYTFLESHEAYASATATVPGWSNIGFLGLFSFTVYKEFNGLFLLPILSAVSQIVMTKIAQAGQPQPSAMTEQQRQQQSTGKFMNWFFPLFSLFICASYNGAFALYWVTSNIVMMLVTLFINWHLDNKEREAKAATEAEGTIR